MTSTDLKNSAKGGERITPPAFLESVWRDPKTGIAITIFIAAFSALIIFMSMPGGPTTAAQALLVMGIGLSTGLIAGLAAKSRWTRLLAPAAFVLTTEIMWLNIHGTTVDAIRLDNVYGILAFILGRGFFGLLALLPMILGVSLGAEAGRRLSGTAAPPAGGFNALLRRAPTVIVSVFLIALAVTIVLPPYTPPIPGDDGKPLPGSIAELTSVNLGGHEQTIMIRGNDTDNPVILYLSGGPGQSDLAYTRVLFAELEKNFVVVSWDQRGNGKSYSALHPESTLTLESATSDTIELTNYLRERFGEDKIYLIGESYGTILGVQAVKNRPDLYYAYIGSGQMVCPKETDRRLWQEVNDYANRTGDKQLSDTMNSYGHPPYRDIYGYITVMSYYDALAGPYDPPEDYINRGRSSGIGPFGVLGSEYSLVEKVNVLRGLLDMFSIMYPRLQDIDYRNDAEKLDVPVYLLDAEHELSARRDLAVEWYNGLEAPHKEMITYRNAGHSVVFEECYNFSRYMNQTIMPDTYPGHK